MVRLAKLFLMACSSAYICSVPTIVVAQWVDLKSLPEDVLNCDECRKRLGLPPLQRESGVTSSHTTLSSIVPSTNQVFQEIILSSRVLPSEASAASTESLPNKKPSRPDVQASVPSTLQTILPKVKLPESEPSVVAAADTSKPEPTDVAKPRPLPITESPRLTPLASAATDEPRREPTKEPAAPILSKPEGSLAQDEPKPIPTDVSERRTLLNESAQTETVAPTETSGIDVLPKRELRMNEQKAAPENVARGQESVGKAEADPDVAPQAAVVTSPQAAIDAIPLLADNPIVPNPKSDESVSDVRIESMKNDQQQPDQAAIVGKRIPPALTGVVDESQVIEQVELIAEEQQATLAKQESVAPAGDEEPIAIAVPTQSEVAKLDDHSVKSTPEVDDASPKNPEASGIVGVAPVNRENGTRSSVLDAKSLVVDGVLTSPAAQKIEIELLKKQLQERDQLLNEFSRMQRSLEEKMDAIVESNDALITKDQERQKEIERIQRGRDQSIQERELRIANLQAEIAGMQVDSREQLNALSKQWSEAHQKRSAEINRLSEQVLSAQKARAQTLENARGKLTAEQLAELAESEKIIEDQKKVIQDMQDALARLGQEVSRLEGSGGVRPKVDAKSIESNNPNRSESVTNSSIRREKSTQDTSTEPRRLSNSTTENSRVEGLKSNSRAKLPTPASSNPPKYDPKRRSF